MAEAGAGLAMGDPKAWLAALLAAGFGGLTGLSEILTHYRDEPIRATFNRYGLAYVGLNGLISLAAFGLLTRYRQQIFPAIEDDLLLTAIVAGFGAMVVMRSKLFTFSSSDGQEYAVGPAIVLDTIMQTIDQKIDRLRAAERQKRVYESLRDVDDFAGAADYLQASLLSFQNLSQQQKTDISSVVADYKGSAWDNRLKVIALGFAFLTVAGEENFDQVVENLKKFLGLGSEGAAAPPRTPAEPALPTPAPPAPPSAEPALTAPPRAPS